MINIDARAEQAMEQFRAIELTRPLVGEFDLRADSQKELLIKNIPGYDLGVSGMFTPLWGAGREHEQIIKGLNLVLAQYTYKERKGVLSLHYRWDDTSDLTAESVFAVIHPTGFKTPLETQDVTWVQLRTAHFYCLDINPKLFPFSKSREVHEAVNTMLNQTLQRLDAV